MKIKSSVPSSLRQRDSDDVTFYLLKLTEACTNLRKTEMRLYARIKHKIALTSLLTWNRIDYLDLIIH